MSAWRKKAMDCLPERKKEFEDPDTSIYDVFIELMPFVVEAHRQKDKDRLERIYGFAEWCFRQKQKDLWNAAGVAFYEHLGDYPETLSGMVQWVKKEIYKGIRELLKRRISERDLAELDQHYLRNH